MNPVRGYPHDLDAERALLSVALLDAPEALAACDGVLRPEDFYLPAHGAIWQAIGAVAQSSAVDTVLVESQLKLAGKLQGCAEALTELQEVVPSGDSNSYGKRIRDLAVCRSVMRRCLELLQVGERPIDDVDAYLDLAESAFKSACDRRANIAVKPIGDVMHETYSDIARRQAEGAPLMGYATGLHDFDRALSGMCSGDLTVLAARPGMGKSALAARVLLGVARSTSMPALVLSVEMNAVQVATRMLASESLLGLSRVRAARLTQHELADLARFADALSKLPVYFLDDRNVRMTDLRREAKRLERTQGQLGLLVVDYMQLMRPEEREEKREREVAELSRALKAFAGEFRCPVLALSQLNRGVEGRSDKRPMLSDLRESGAIEQDADNVVFIYRDEVYNPKTTEPGIAEVIVAKQRSGPPGTIRLAWASSVTRFDNLERHQQEELTYEQQP